jgi:hypothetical protein
MTTSVKVEVGKKLLESDLYNNINQFYTIMIKKSIFKVFVFATAMTGAMVLTSCNHDDALYNPEMVQQAKHAEDVAKYEQTFVNIFGQPAANQSWDFTMGGKFAATRATVVNPSNLQAWPSQSDYVYGLNYKAVTGSADPLQENIINNLFNNHLTEIYAKINSATPQDWNPSGTYLFRTFSTHKGGDIPKKTSKYYSVGANFNNSNNVLAQEQHKWNDNNPDKRGTTGSQHTRSLNFNMVPAGAIWFASATTSGEGEINLNDCKLSKFVEVEYDGYTFWGFKCESGYTDIVLIVKKISVEKTLEIAKRYMVEDLGGSGESDIDFNDIVFDMEQYSDGSQRCVVRALGGTLPIRIKIGSSAEWSKPEPVSKMINTQGVIDEFQEIAVFDIPAKDWNHNTNNVEVYVENGDGYEFVTTFPANGRIPAMIAFSTTKVWNYEKVSVTEEWFNTYPFVYEEDVDVE